VGDPFSSRCEEKAGGARPASGGARQIKEIGVAAPRLILRSDAKHRISKDGPVQGVGRAGWSVLRGATLSMAPQDEGELFG
jgi:hypothetical protein